MRHVGGTCQSHESLVRVLFAPDWRPAPYQVELERALATHGVTVEFLSRRRRGLPLARGTAGASTADVLHLHWPEAYFAARDGWDWARCLRFPLDLQLARRWRPLVVTAHNLRTHDRTHEFLTNRAMRQACRCADVVFAHSRTAAAELTQSCGVPSGRIRVIPHGDLTAGMPTPVTRAEARTRLGLGAQ